MFLEFLKWLGLVLLVVSLMQDDIKALRYYGIASTLALLVGYYDDIQLTIIHVLIIGIYVRKMIPERQTAPPRCKLTEQYNTYL